MEVNIFYGGWSCLFINGVSFSGHIRTMSVVKEVVLNRKKKVTIERHTEEPGLFLEDQQIHMFGHECIKPEADSSRHSATEGLLQELSDRIHLFESFKPGLAPYY